MLHSRVSCNAFGVFAALFGKLMSVIVQVVRQEQGVILPKM
jgi:hypothetical protein